MKNYFYDFHIHSCLSPCADNDNTPYNIAGMAALAGLDIVALTDHNSLKNCPAFFAAAEKNGIIPVAGVELTTAEDIHIICLFEQLEQAVRFDGELYSHRTLIKNKPEIFGEQLIIGDNDEVIGIDEYLLINATDITVDSVTELVRRFSGVCYPAHIDRQANGIIETLGVFPANPDFFGAELRNPDYADRYIREFPVLSGKRLLFGSDAHCLRDIRDGQYQLELGEGSADDVRRSLFKLFRGERP